MKDYQAALESTAMDKIGAPGPGSDLERLALERFKDFFASVTPESAREKGPLLYAPKAYFNDTVKTLHSQRDITDYFVRTARRCKLFEVYFTDVARSGENFYMRWVMTFQVSGLGRGRPLTSFGMSHIRFDRDGFVALHQDYWDMAGGILDHVPVMGSFLKLAKRFF